MIFDTRVNGIPCQCQVTAWEPYIPPRITGMGMGDCDPPEEEYFEYVLLDRNGRPAPWLDRYRNADLDDRLRDEFLALRSRELMAL